MNKCPFCKIDNKDISNTIIDETKYFNILPSKGALCNGYLLIVPELKWSYFIIITILLIVIYFTIKRTLKNKNTENI